MKKNLSFCKGSIQKLKPLLEQKYNVSELSIIGSFVRGEQATKSDLDILQSYSKLPNLFGFIELMQYLEEKLGIEVDLVMKDDLKPSIAK